MDTQLQIYLERIRTFRANEQFQRSRHLIDEAFGQGLNGAELYAESIGLGLILDPWEQVLERLIASLDQYPFSVLCGGANRGDFLRLVREYAGFRDRLLDYFLKTANLEAIRDWVSLSEDQEKHWLTRHWSQLALETEDPNTIAFLQTAAGMGLFILDEWDEAWEKWCTALETRPDLLQNIMTLCKTAMDTHNLVHRFRLIRLIAAAGKKKDAMSLLHALASEDPDNARTVLLEMNQFPPFPPGDREMTELRFGLALRVQDPELLFQVIGEMDRLGEDDLFLFRKQAMSKITDKMLRRLVLQEFVRLYIRNQDWENAALLLESLYEDEPHGEIVSLMELVTDHYPIMSRLHFVIGRHHLRHGKPEHALKYLDIIIDVKEFQSALTSLLEDYLADEFEASMAERLVRLLPPGSHKACLLAIRMIDDQGVSCGPLVKRIEKWRGRKLPGPLWFLAMMQGYNNLEKYAESYTLFCEFLLNYPKVSPEVLIVADQFRASYRADYTKAVALIKDFQYALAPTEAWIQIKDSFEEATRLFLESPPEQEPERDPEPEAEAAPDPTTSTPEAESTDEEDPKSRTYDIESSEFRGLLAMGKWVQAAKAARELVREEPGNIERVMNKLEELAATHPREPLWVKTMLDVLLITENWRGALELGRKTTENPYFQSGLPEFYQYTAQAYDGLGKEQEALRFYCLASREETFYEKNKEVLVEKVFPNYTQFLKEILQLILTHEDREIWRKLLYSWHRHQPNEINHLIQAQIAFTNREGSPQSILDLAEWRLQAGNAAEFTRTLNRVDLRDPGIHDGLVHLINLANLKAPDDPKPKFILARYYLLHQKTAKAVDTFRNLAKQAPDTAQPIFKFLRNYLKKHPDTIDVVHLYGLLIRFALSYGPATAAVKLLHELGKNDREGAESLVGGVLRTLVNQKDKPDVVYELGKLLWHWKRFELVLEVHERGELGTHMAYERLKWFQEVKAVPTLHDRAVLASAQLWFDILEYSKCRDALGQIQDQQYRRQALRIYDRLSNRFPEDMSIWREAGWAAFTEDPDKARHFFGKVIENDPPENHMEAYAVLSELGAAPDFDKLRAITKDENRIYRELSDIYVRIREMTLFRWERKECAPPIASLEWLLVTDQLERFRKFMPRFDELDRNDRNLLEAKYFHTLGQVTQCAWRATRGDAPTSLIQSFFFNADLVERAIYQKTPKTRLAKYLREAFMRRYGEPKMIRARFATLRRLQRENIAPEKK